MKINKQFLERYLNSNSPTLEEMNIVINIQGLLDVVKSLHIHLVIVSYNKIKI